MATIDDPFVLRLLTWVRDAERVLAEVGANPAVPNALRTNAQITKGGLAGCRLRIEVPEEGFNCWAIVTPNGEIAWSQGYQSDPEKQANARLIAAAPDMLAALRDAKQQIEYLHEKFQETGSGNAVLARIERAIAKAEGSAP